MKTKILLLSLFASVISINAFSQQLKISVNQLDAGLDYTRNQIINALGTPSEIINDPDDVFADAVTYKYGNNSFTTNYLYGYTYLSVLYRLDSNVIYKIVLETILL